MPETLTGPLYLEMLLKAERLDEAAFRASQLRLVERLCRDAASCVGHYNKTLRPLFENGNPHMGAFRHEAWDDIPVVRRADMQADQQAFYSRSERQEAKDYRESHTSGSSGAPFYFRKSVLVDQATTTVANRAFAHFGLNLSADMADIRVILAGSDGDSDGEMEKTWNFSDKAGAHRYFEIRRPIEEQWRWLKEVRPGYLLSYPSNLRQLARLARSDLGHRLKLAAFIATAEPLPADVMGLAEAVFGAPVINIYGTREFGHMATACPETGHLHVSADITMIEVLDEAGRHVEPGETGEIVATSFYNYAMPFIRYATGDFAVFGGRCPCGRVLPVLQRVLGRARNRFTLAGGRCVWPIRDFDELTERFAIDDYRIIQTDAGRFKFHYVAAKTGEPFDENVVAGYLRQHLAPDIRIDFISQDAIAPSGYAKQERYISQLTQ